MKLLKKLEDTRLNLTTKLKYQKFKVICLTSIFKNLKILFFQTFFLFNNNLKRLLLTLNIIAIPNKHTLIPLMLSTTCPWL